MTLSVVRIYAVLPECANPEISGEESPPLARPSCGVARLIGASLAPDGRTGPGAFAGAGPIQVHLRSGGWNC